MGEEEVDAALARGQGVTFESAEDFMTHLRKLDREASEREDAAAGTPEPAARRSARGQRDQRDPTSTRQQRSPRGGDVSALEDLPAARTAIRLRHHREVVTLDQRRALLEVVAAGATARDIAALLGISQHAVTALLQSAEGTPPVLEGFSGATPLEIAQRYAAGLIPREQVVSELVAFPYTPTPSASAWDDLVVDPPGAWSELETAQGLHLIDASIYRDVFLALHPEYAEEYAEEYAQEIAAEGEFEESGGAQPLDPAGVTTQERGGTVGESQDGPPAPAGDGQSAAPRT